MGYHCDGSWVVRYNSLGERERIQAKQILCVHLRSHNVLIVTRMGAGVTETVVCCKSWEIKRGDRQNKVRMLACDPKAC